MKDDTEGRGSRRQFLLGALGALPVLGALAGCSDEDGGAERPGEPREDAGKPPTRPEEASVPDPRERIRELMQAHVTRENAHDVAGILETFASGAVMTVNGTRYDSVEAIRGWFVDFGLAKEGGGLTGAVVQPVNEYFVDDGRLLVEGKMTGKHTGVVAGLPPTGLEAEVAYFTFYEFDAAGKLASKVVVINTGMLALRDPPPA